MVQSDDALSAARQPDFTLQILPLLHDGASPANHRLRNAIPLGLRPIEIVGIPNDLSGVIWSDVFLEPKSSGLVLVPEVNHTVVRHHLLSRWESGRAISGEH